VASPHVHIPFDRIKKYSPLLAEKRLNLEIYFSAGVLDSTDVANAVGRVEALGYNPSISLHAPFMDLSPGAVDRKVREVTMFRFGQIMDMASELKPEVVVFHSGYEKWKYALNVHIWLEKSLLTWEKMVERAADIGTKIAIENIFEDTPHNLQLLMEKMGSDHFGLCFDTGHFNLFSTVSLEEWLERTGDHIIELHLHDNDGTRDAHTIPGQGTFDFEGLFRLIGGNRKIVRTIEAHKPEEVIASIEAVAAIDNT